MIERVEDALVRPWVRLRVETLVAEMTGMGFAEEREVAVEVGVPGNGTNGQGGCGRKGCARVHDGLS